jgi:hypothetical protein
MMEPSATSPEDMARRADAMTRYSTIGQLRAVGDLFMSVS